MLAGRSRPNGPHDIEGNSADHVDFGSELGFDTIFRRNGTIDRGAPNVSAPRLPEALSDKLREDLE